MLTGRNLADGRVGWDIIDYHNPRPPDYYTKEAKGNWLLWTREWYWPLIQSDVFSICWGSPQSGVFAHWARIRGWTTRPKEVLV